MSVKFYICLLIPLLLVLGCLKQRYKREINQTTAEYKPLEKQLLESEESLSIAEKISNEHPDEQSKHTIERRIEEAKKKIIDEERKKLEKKLRKEEKRKKHLENKKELDFEVENLTGKTKYVVCFSYIKQQNFTRWHWDKSEVYKLLDGQSTIIDIEKVENELDRKNVYGFLGIFDEEQQAIDSTYELLQDSNKIDIDKLIKLKKKKVIIGIEKYGFKKELLDYRIINEIEKRVPELDFIVENKTGRPLIITCFVYQKKKNQHVWRYDKTPVKRVDPDEMAIIDVDPISSKYDRVYLRATLAVFDKSEEKLAEKMTYELLPEKNKIELYRLMMLRNKKVVLEAEKYGILGDIVKFGVKPINKIIKYSKMKK